MVAAAQPEKCRVCGSIAQLTFEHVPPKAAFNNHGVLFVAMKDLLLRSEVGDPRTARRHKAPRGVGGNTLCARCNNETGALYGVAYADWAFQGMRYRFAAREGSSLQLPFHFFPGRIAKQVMCMFASACGVGLFDANHDLRRFVLNKDHRGLPPKYRLFAYLMAARSGNSRQSGITGLISGIGHGSRTHTFSEIAFPPFGYVLTIDSPPPFDDKLLDITAFAGFGYHDFRSEYLRMPLREVNSYFPADFRTREQWEDSLNRAHGTVERPPGASPDWSGR